MGERIFCPGCGVPIDNPGRSCPSCLEPLPAPKTVVGYGDLTAERIDVPEPAAPQGAGAEPALGSTWNSASEPGPAPVPAPAPAEANPHVTFPGHPGPSASPAAVIVPAPEPALPPASEMAPSKMAVSVREPPVLGDAPLAGIGMGGSTTPGFPEAPAVPRKQTLQIESAAQEAPPPAAPLAPPVAQQPPPAQQPAPLPAAAAQPQAGYVAPQPQQPNYPAPQPQAAPNYAAAQSPQAAPGYVAAQALVPQPVAGQPQSPTEPRGGPPAAAFNPPPPYAQPGAQQPFVYGQPAAPVVPVPPTPVQPAPAEAAIAPAASELAPTDTRRGLMWRALTGGALLTWTLLFGLTACVFIAVHLVMFLEHGLGNMHANTFTTFGVAAGALIPALLLMVASVSCLSGRGWPRATALTAALTHVGWTGAGLYVLIHTFDMYRTAKYGAIACGVSALVTIIAVVVLLTGGKWVSKSPIDRPARAVPFPLWAGPMLIVLGTLSIVREAIPLVQVGFRAAKASRFKYAAEKFYESYPLFWAGAAGLLFSIVLVVAGIALLRRKRWAVGLGGVAGLLTLIADLAAILTLYIGDGIHKHGGALFGTVDMFILLAYGVTAWVALAGAARFGFRLPRYLRDVPDKGEDGKRVKLLEALVPTGTQTTQGH